MNVSFLRLISLGSALIALVGLPALRSAELPPLLDHAGNPAGFHTLAIGDAAPDFALTGTDGKTHRLADFAGPEVLMVLFTSNHCPTAHAVEGRIKKIRDDMRGKSFAIVAINPNHPDGLSLDELGYGEFNDSFAEMKPYAEKAGYDFPYLYDGDKQLIARAYGCLATPHIFIFDQQRKLRYSGRLDDSRLPDEATVKTHDARNAIDALFAGQPVPVALTKPHGCSTKWREKHATNVAIEAAWTKIPVAIEHIDAAGVAALRANPTNKFRLINVWATWCAPCVEEFPSIVSLSRQFDQRNFELVTVSMDEAKDEAKAMTFLQKQGAGLTKRRQTSVNQEGRKTNHYLYTSAGQDELVAALDPEWPGPLPHTVLVAPGGKIVWRCNGPIDHSQALEAIVAALSPYWDDQMAPPKKVASVKP